MANLKLIRGQALRATKLDGCGAVVLGPDSKIQSDGFVSIALTANTEAGEAINVTNAAGKPVISDNPTPRFVNYGVAINFAGVNPELVTLLTGQPAVRDGDDNVVGFGVDDDVDVDLVGFALEFWTGVAVAACEEGQTAQYGYGILPFLKGGVLGDFTIENNAISFSLSGASTRSGNAWGVGPYDVVLDENGVESPLLEPLPTKRHLHMQLTGVAPPSTDDDSGQEVGVEATGATAGTPGSWTPANSYGPLDLAELQASGITASPNTAWTTGQSVVLRDGTRAHWTSSAWAAGPA